MNNFIMVPSDKEFKFKKICPYCGADMTYHCEGWEEDENGLWKAEYVTGDCASEPEMENEEEWDNWFSTHSDMPYVYQLPVDIKIMNFINKKYRFKLN